MRLKSIVFALMIGASMAAGAQESRDDLPPTNARIADLNVGVLLEQPGEAPSVLRCTENRVESVFFSGKKLEQVVTFLVYGFGVSLLANIWLVLTLRNESKARIRFLEEGGEHV